MSVQFLFALIFGILTGVCLALLFMMIILNKNILGKNENRFERYSKAPINILEEHECMTYLGMDSGIRWRNLRKQSAGMNEAESKAAIDEAIATMKALENENNAFCERME